MADSTVRQRKPAPEEEPEKVQTPEKEETEETEETPLKKGKKVITDIDDEELDSYSPWLDILRVLTFLLLASCGLSYVISGGDSWWWGLKHKPTYMTVDYWKEILKGPDPPINLTLDQLATFDGTDPEKPLYIGLNGTIYDVSNGRRIYGPGGSYHGFAGVDAARAFVTGCFADDRNADLRGIELMYMPLDDPEIDAHWTEKELAAMRVQELEAAKLKAYNALLHWVNFFSNSRKYKKVGSIIREKDWLEKEEPKKLCAPAANGRKKRTVPTV
ncbi:hypothetical protein BKA56DRAFT_582995 [Ilyonectria sp. MPI-CAGE-AT-0026]|nr:hypothetical protein BKA56DRAFT_582995 [Ilyonectria sp. MPI-CAGE-AT-0026]